MNAVSGKRGIIQEKIKPAIGLKTSGKKKLLIRIGLKTNKKYCEKYSELLAGMKAHCRLLSSILTGFSYSVLISIFVIWLAP